MNQAGFQCGEGDDRPFSSSDTPERVFLNDIIAIQVRPGGFEQKDMVVVFEKVKFLHISELFISLHMKWVTFDLLPYLCTNGDLEELVVPNPILFRLEYINAMKEFLSKMTRPIKVKWMEEGQVKRDLNFNEENSQAMRELLLLARAKGVSVSIMRMATYLKLMGEAYQKEAAEMIQQLIEIDDGDFPLLKKVGRLMNNAVNLERMSIRDHEPVPNDFDYGEVFSWVAEWMPKKLQAFWISLPMCRESLASLKWPQSVSDIGLRISAHENRLAKVVGNIGAQCPSLRNLDLCLEHSIDPNKAFIALKPGDFRCLRNLQVKTSAQANFLLNDHSMFCVARLPLQELILCFQTDDAFIPGRPPFHTIPGSLISSTGLHAVSVIETLLCFAIRIQDGGKLRARMERSIEKMLGDLEIKLEKRKQNTPPEVKEAAFQFTLMALMVGNMDRNWFLTMPKELRNGPY